MDISKVKFLIQSIEVLIDELKSEVYTKEETFKVSDTDYYEEDTREVTRDAKNLFPEVMDDL